VSRILAIDTAGPVLGLAVAEDGAVVHRVEEHGPVQHVEHLVPHIEIILRQCDWPVTSLAAVAVAAGPGSFTGLRVGMAAAKAIALAVGIPVVSVDSLEALAATERFLASAPVTELLIPVLDARKQRLYTAVFETTDGELTRLEPDGDLTVEAFRTMVRRHTTGGRAWRAPGPMAYRCMSEEGAAETLADRVTAAPGVAIRGAVALQQGRVDGPYDGPFYLREGDIGTRKASPRFRPDA